MHLFLEDDEGVVIAFAPEEIIIVDPKRAAMALFKATTKYEKVTRLYYFNRAFVIDIENNFEITLLSNNIKLNSQKFWDGMITEFYRLVKLKAFL